MAMEKKKLTIQSDKQTGGIYEKFNRLGKSPGFFDYVRGL